jgi:hypothetical protein
MSRYERLCMLTCCALSITLALLVLFRYQVAAWGLEFLL